MKQQLKWLLLIPAFAVVIGLGIFVPKLVSGDSGGGQPASTSKQVSQVAQQQMDDDQQQIDSYQDMVTKNPRDLLAMKKLGDVYFDLADIQTQNGSVNDSAVNFKKAIDQYRQYLAINPGDVEVRIDLGYSYVQLNMPEVALRELQTVTAAAPSNQRGWLNMGYLYLQTGKTAECKVTLQKAIDLDPNSEFGKDAKRLLDQASSASQQSLAVPPASP